MFKFSEACNITEINCKCKSGVKYHEKYVILLYKKICYFMFSETPGARIYIFYRTFSKILCLLYDV